MSEHIVVEGFRRKLDMGRKLRKQHIDGVEQKEAWMKGSGR